VSDITIEDPLPERFYLSLFGYKVYGA
jgi:hypothetical protein